MADLTLESLAKRQKDWRKAFGMFSGSSFMKQVDTEGYRLREAEREAARREGEDSDA
jgi:hypothetical protein